MMRLDGIKTGERRIMLLDEVNHLVRLGSRPDALYVSATKKGQPGFEK